MQRICTWPKIWTLSGRLSLMCNVQLMKKNKNIFRVIYKNIYSIRNVCVLTSASMIVYIFFTRSWSAIIGPKLFFTRSWSAIIGTKQPKVNQSPQQWWGRQTCTLICRFLVVGNIFRLETCMNSLVKVPPYSKLNFQGKIFFTQNWCNITLSQYMSLHFKCNSLTAYARMMLHYKLGLPTGPFPSWWPHSLKLKNYQMTDSCLKSPILFHPCPVSFRVC
jgi:hypothetical protein